MSQPDALTWEAALARYESHLRARRASPRTVAGYLRELELLSERLALPPARVTLQGLREHLCGLMTGTRSISGRPLAAGTVARTATAYKCFFAFLLAEGLSQEDPARRLERPKVPRYPPGDVLSLREIKRLLASCPETPHGLRDRAILELLYATGIRLSEIVALDIADLDHGERELLIRAGKGEKARILPLTRSAYHQVCHYLKQGRERLASTHPDSAQALLLSRLGRRLCKRALANVLASRGQKAGVKKGVKPHMLRRTFATHLLKGGASVRHIQELLGHTDLNTTALYLKLDRRELRQELHLRHPREGFEV